MAIIECGFRTQCNWMKIAKWCRTWRWWVNRGYRDAHPTSSDVLLLIEVANITMTYDRELKIPLYARHGIPEVWLLDATEGRMECYREPALGNYRESGQQNPMRH